MTKQKRKAMVLRAMNHCFPRPVHPFNLRNETEFSYADWQFEKAPSTLNYYLEQYSIEELFVGKRVLDFGCGEAGKSVYYAGLGAKEVVGMDIVPEYEERAVRFAQKHDCSNFSFICADVTSLPIPSDHLDTIIMNDFMEHVSDPEKTLRETIRILRPGGRAFINFPPYHHPYGAHLSDEISIPWVHELFDEQTIISEYKSRVRNLPDGEERIRLRFSKGEDGLDHLTYINHMTIERFEEMLERLAIEPEYYHLTPLRPWLAPLAKIPACREYLNKMVTCVIRKEDKQGAMQTKKCGDL